MRSLHPAAIMGLCGMLSIPLVALMHKNQDLIFDSYLANDYSFTDSSTLQSSYDGKITALYVTSHTPEERKQEYESVSRFFSAPVYVLTDTDFASQGNVHSLSVPYVFHGWMRDLFLFSEDSVLANPFISLNRDSSYQNKRHFTDQVRSSLDVLVSQGFEPETTPFIFEGGQVLRSDSYTLVPDFFNDARNLMAPELMASEGNLSSYEILQSYDQSVGNTLFVPTMVGDQSHMSGHLDMFITIVGPDTIFVADYTLGRELFEQVSDTEQAAFKQKLAETYSHLSGDSPCEISFEFPSDGTEVFDKAAAYLSRTFTVKRTPFVGINVNSGVDNTNDRYLSYNNVLLDHSTGKAVIPSFGLTTLDSYAEQMYTDEGYSSLLILDSVKGVVTHSGIHCDYLEKRETIETLSVF